MVLFSHGLRGSQPCEWEPHPLALCQHREFGKPKGLDPSVASVLGRRLRHTETLKASLLVFGFLLQATTPSLQQSPLSLKVRSNTQNLLQHRSGRGEEL